MASINKPGRWRKYHLGNQRPGAAHRPAGSADARKQPAGQKAADARKKAKAARKARKRNRK